MQVTLALKLDDSLQVLLTSMLLARGPLTEIPEVPLSLSWSSAHVLAYGLCSRVRRFAGRVKNGSRLLDLTRQVRVSGSPRDAGWCRERTRRPTSPAGR